MSDQEYGKFIVKVIETLKNNGFPANQVALPLEKMYETAHHRGINFNKVLEFLSTKEMIDHRKTDDKIIFFARKDSHEAEIPEPEFNWEDVTRLLGNIDLNNPGELLQKSQEVLKTLPPEQLKKIMGMFHSLSDEKKEEILKKGKDLGFVPE